jgi:hypothetical protein
MKSLDKFNAYRMRHGNRKAGIILIDKYLNQEVSLSSADLTDSSIFMNGLDAVEEALYNNDIQGAVDIAKSTALEMVDDELDGGAFFEHLSPTQSMRKLMEAASDNYWFIRGGDFEHYKQQALNNTDVAENKEKMEYIVHEYKLAMQIADKEERQKMMKDFSEGRKSTF